MEFKGTKGNWRIGVLGSVQNERGEFICESERNKATEEENKANNLLISKSPQILEALKHTLEVLYECDPPKHLEETYANLFANYNNLIQEAVTV